MDKFLEELRAQRGQIKAHLDWLDQKIEKLEKAPNTESATPEGGDTTAEKVTPPEPKETTQATTPPGDEKIEELAAANTTTYGSSTSSDIKRLQVGCSVIFVVATTLFIFLLFGLPKLLDSERPEPHQNQDHIDTGSSDAPTEAAH